MTINTMIVMQLGIKIAAIRDGDMGCLPVGAACLLALRGSLGRPAVCGAELVLARGLANGSTVEGRFAPGPPRNESASPGPSPVSAAALAAGFARGSARGAAAGR